MAHKTMMFDAATRLSPSSVFPALRRFPVSYVSLKTLDPNRPIREEKAFGAFSIVPR